MFREVRDQYYDGDEDPLTRNLLSACWGGRRSVGHFWHASGMTFASIGSLETRPGRRDDVVAILTRPSPDLARVGCLLYEVGVDEAQPDTVFVVELWETAQAHRASLELESTRAAIAEAMPLLTGVMSGSRFEVVGSPLRG